MKALASGGLDQYAAEQAERKRHIFWSLEEGEKHLSQVRRDNEAYQLTIELEKTMEDEARNARIKAQEARAAWAAANFGGGAPKGAAGFGRVEVVRFSSTCVPGQRRSVPWTG